GAAAGKDAGDEDHGGLRVPLAVKMWDGSQPVRGCDSGRPAGGGRVENPSHIPYILFLNSPAPMARAARPPRTTPGLARAYSRTLPSASRLFRRSAAGVSCMG